MVASHEVADTLVVVFHEEVDTLVVASHMEAGTVVEGRMEAYIMVVAFQLGEAHRWVEVQIWFLLLIFLFFLEELG